MDICISVGGRFHAFNLAKQLDNRGHLKRLITSYPRFEVAKYGIPRERVTSLPTKEVVMRVGNRLPAPLRWSGLEFRMLEWFDRQASRRLPECDLCTAWSGFALHTIRAARARGAVTVVERGSAHIEVQRDILEEEYARHGIRKRPVHPLVVEKELQEYAEADYIAVPSRFAKRSFLEKGVPEEKLIHVPYGVGLDEFRPLGPRPDVFRVINVGTQSLQKGTPYLLQALAELNLPDSELLLVGHLDDEVRPMVERYPGRLRHVPPVPQTELVRYYAMGSVFVIFSVQEGLAMVQAQAMACGLPVICTTNTGGEDLVRDGVDGFVLAPRDVEGLKARLVQLYENRERLAAMGDSARARVQTGFSWNDYGDNITAAYHERVARRDAAQGAVR